MIKILLVSVLIALTLISGCGQEDIQRDSYELLSPEVEPIEAGEIVNLVEIDGTYRVYIAEYDEENECTWFNCVEVDEEEFFSLEIGEHYTVN